jgi:squalene synthase HpnC
MLYNSKNIIDLTETDGGEFRCTSIEDAYKFTKRLSLSHYENFPIGSILIPKKFRKHIYAIYCFARVADDISDEDYSYSSQQKSILLDKYQCNLGNWDFGNSSNPIFLSLNNTIKELSLPLLPFEKLITAFKMDANFQRPETFEDLMKYCYYSANPIGELVLRTFGEYNRNTRIYSDFICSGLQLTNFWQDLSVDLGNNREYIPKSFLIKYQIEELSGNTNRTKIQNCLDELYVLTNELFDKGEPLVKELRNKRLKLEIRAILAGGRMILKKSKNLKTEILVERPKLLKSDLFKIFLKTIFG